MVTSQSPHSAESLKTHSSRSGWLAKGLILLALATSCQKNDPSFQLGSMGESLLLAPDYVEVPQKLDLLLVVDNSGSMETSQQHLNRVFPQFLQKLLHKKYDFHLAVTTTEAYMSKTHGSAHANKSLLRRASSGEFYLTRDTQDLELKFQQMVLAGINGYGDERAHLSIQATLEDVRNAEFRREDAFLAILIISDEDDFSHLGTQFTESYSFSGLLPTSHFVNFLNQYAGVGNYSVYSISILDEACRERLANSFRERKIGRRYHELVAATGGVNGSLCDDFSDSVNFISDSIIFKIPPVTRFQLRVEPRIETIVVTINGERVAADGQDGWIYSPDTRTLELVGQSARRVQDGGKVDISYVPLNPFAQ